MKKSEMLHIIFVAISACKNESIQEQAQNVLDMIEAHGMQPPTIITMPNSYNRSEGTYGFESNEWEPEND